MSDNTHDFILGYRTALSAVASWSKKRRDLIPSGPYKAAMETPFEVLEVFLLKEAVKISKPVPEESDDKKDLSAPVGCTIQELQDNLPWGAHNYSQAFQAYGVPHRDFAHALLHVQKAVGKLAIAVDNGDHEEHPSAFFGPDDVDRFVADLVICALRLANTNPGRRINLQAAIEDRLALKFGKK
jgi:hypothetical protein